MDHTHGKYLEAHAGPTREISEKPPARAASAHAYHQVKARLALYRHYLLSLEQPTLPMKPLQTRTLYRHCKGGQVNRGHLQLRDLASLVAPSDGPIAVSRAS